VRSVLPHLALVAMLAVVGAISWQALHVLDTPADPIAEKFATAERTIAYQVTASDGPRFRLDGTGAPIKVVSYAVVDGAYDPARRIAYGLRVRVEGGGRTLWQSDLYLESRQSKGRQHRGGWRDEATFALERLELTDERILVIDPPAAPAGSVLTMTVLGESREALVRVFRGGRRGGARREVLGQLMDEADRVALVRSSTYLPWELIPDVEKDRRLRRRWTRMSALGERGPDYRTRTIFVSTFRAPLPSATAGAAGFEVARGRSLAINVRGPTTVTLSRTDDGIAGAGAAGGPAAAADCPPAETAIDISAVGVAAGPWQLGPEQRSLAIDVPAGVATLVLATDSALPVVVALSGPPDHWIAPADLQANVAPDQLTPDRSRISLAIVTPTAPVIANVRDVPGAPWLGRVLRVDARVLDAAVQPRASTAASADAPSAAAAPDDVALATLTVRFVGRDGREVGRDRLVVGGSGSPFERLEWGGVGHAVSEPSAARTFAPAGAARVEITADQPVALRLYRWSAEPTTIGAPYRDLDVPDHRWRYTELDGRTWWPLQPANRDAVTAEGRDAELVAQARLEPTGEPSDDDLVERERRRALAARPLVAVRPVGHPEQQRAREPVPPERAAAVLGHWPTGALTQLRPGETRRIDFGIPRPGRARLSYEVDAAQVGKQLVIAIGDAAPVRVPITASRGAIVLPHVAAKVQRVRVTGPRRATLFVDRPPVGSARGLFRERRVYSLAHTVRVRVNARAGRRVRLLAIVYAAGPAPSARPAVRIVVDRGHPRRRSGVVLDKLTDTERAATLPAARRDAPARLPDLGGRSAGLPRAIGVTLLEDLVPGAHEIEIVPIGRGREMWVRFVATEAPAAAPGDPRQWQIAPDWGDGGDDAP